MKKRGILSLTWIIVIIVTVVAGLITAGIFAFNFGFSWKEKFGGFSGEENGADTEGCTNTCAADYNQRPYPNCNCYKGQTTAGCSNICTIYYNQRPFPSCQCYKDFDYDFIPYLLDPDDNDPTNPDPNDPEFPVDGDGDGYYDEEEEDAGTDPEDPEDFPEEEDTDGDGYTDEEEEGAGTDPNDSGDYPGVDTELDSDSDYYTDAEEESYGTDPNSAQDNPCEDRRVTSFEYWTTYRGRSPPITKTCEEYATSHCTQIGKQYSFSNWNEDLECCIWACEDIEEQEQYTCGQSGTAQCTGTCPPSHPDCVDVHFAVDDYYACVCANNDEMHSDWHPGGTYHNPIEEDADGDGIPDSEDTDNDNDGWDDVVETAAGTNPSDSNNFPVCYDSDASSDMYEYILTKGFCQDSTGTYWDDCYDGSHVKECVCSSTPKRCDCRWSGNCPGLIPMGLCDDGKCTN